MKKEKIQAIQLHAGIDTFEIKTHQEIQPIGNAIFVPELARKYPKTNTFFYKLNPDKFSGKQIYNRSSFVDAVGGMFDYLQLNNPVISRIDLRFDSFKNNYESIQKLNKFLIMLVAHQENLTNCYESINPLLLEPLCVRTQGQYLEIDNYNKAAEEPEGNVINRLELRSKKLYTRKNNIDCLDVVEFEKWLDRLEQAINKNNISMCQQKLNESLIRRFSIERKTNNFTTNELLCKYQNSIFSCEQLEELYKHLGYKNPKRQVAAYRSRKGIEMITDNNLQDYVKLLKNSFSEFKRT